jgi:hypothetical protein
MRREQELKHPFRALKPIAYRLSDARRTKEGFIEATRPQPRADRATRSGLAIFYLRE